MMVGKPAIIKLLTPRIAKVYLRKLTQKRFLSIAASVALLTSSSLALAAQSNTSPYHPSHLVDTVLANFNDSFLSLTEPANILTEDELEIVSPDAWWEAPIESISDVPLPEASTLQEDGFDNALMDTAPGWVPPLRGMDVVTWHGQNVDIQAVEHEDQSASLYLNTKEVVRFRSASKEDGTPYERALLSAEAFKHFLEADGDPSSIERVEENDTVYLTSDDKVLLYVDMDTAKQVPGHTPKTLANTWTQLICNSLGAKVPTFVSEANKPESWADRFKATGARFTGMASWYGPQFHGRRMANGRRFNQYALTAAHRRLPFGTLVRVKNNRTNRSVVVEITDRGPFAHGRVLDLSRGAADAIGLTSSGVAMVTVEVVSKQALADAPL